MAHSGGPYEAAEPQAPDDEQRALAQMYLAAIRSRDEAIERIEQIKALMYEAIPDGVAVEVGDVVVVRGSRRPNRALNMVGLLSRGVPRDEISVSRPSVPRFLAYAEREGWSEADVNNYILDTGDPQPYVQVRQIRLTDDDDLTEE